ncbi:MAG: metal ABC transporter ATP-binding protein [Alphaproteobacteria bacterium]|nr:metal ABC transporter ATP-binding protein [Alphaproteobacteria bacterium]
MTPSIDIDALTVAYDGGDVLHGVSGRFPAGVLCAVVGPNGSGKTTLLKTIAGLLKPRAGRVQLAGGRTGDIAYLPQRAGFDRTFPIAVRDVVAMGLWPRSGGFRRITRAQRDEVEAAVAAVGLAAVAGMPIGTLSGGQTRRVLFARTMLQDAPAILLDEPFANVDADTTAYLLALMEGWRKEGRIVVAVLHDLDLAQKHFGWTMLLAHESVACGPTAAVLTPENLRRARHLCERCAADRNFWAAA